MKLPVKSVKLPNLDKLLLTRQQQQTNQASIRVLGIESSCDDSCASVLRYSLGGETTIESDVRYNQSNIHQPFGGIVPSLAQQAHKKELPGVVREALMDNEEELDAIFVTSGPGMTRCLAEGVNVALRLGERINKPVYKVNHLRAHALTSRMFFESNAFPYFLLLVSGGHTFLSLATGICHHRLLGETLDDSIGEAFDKVARLLNLNGGGVELERAAAMSKNKTRFQLPIPMRKGKSDKSAFSFSGLKTACKTIVSSNPAPDPAFVNDVAFAFQHAAFTHLEYVLQNRAVRQHPSVNSLVVCGGVASNQELRQRLHSLLPECQTFFPAPRFCVDNAVMIAWAGLEELNEGCATRLPWDTRASEVVREKW